MSAKSVGFSGQQANDFWFQGPFLKEFCKFPLSMRTVKSEKEFVCLFVCYGFCEKYSPTCFPVCLPFIFFLWSFWCIFFNPLLPT